MNYSELVVSSSKSKVQDEKTGELARPTTIAKHEVMTRFPKIRSEEKTKE